MASLLIGPMLRYVSHGEATIWLEADACCAVKVLGCRTETFQVNGRHYAIVAITGLTAGSCVEYEVLLDGVRAGQSPTALCRRHGSARSRSRGRSSWSSALVM
ncbi:hypothetical protein BH20ACT16_BH20ACT16_05710 [soil metagenome]|jgi:hypothetical protein